MYVGCVLLSLLSTNSASRSCAKYVPAPWRRWNMPPDDMIFTNDMYMMYNNRSRSPAQEHSPMQQAKKAKALPVELITHHSPLSVKTETFFTFLYTSPTPSDVSLLTNVRASG